MLKTTTLLTNTLIPGSAHSQARLVHRLASFLCYPPSKFRDMNQAVTPQTSSGLVPSWVLLQLWHYFMHQQCGRGWSPPQSGSLGEDGVLLSASSLGEDGVLLDAGSLGEDGVLLNQAAWEKMGFCSVQVAWERMESSSMHAAWDPPRCRQPGREWSPRQCRQPMGPRQCRQPGKD